MQERFEAFTLLIGGINRSIRTIKSEEMAAFDLKSPHLSCLYYLYVKGALTAKELCIVCEEDKANISRSIAFLESEGYITCGKETSKRYQTPLHLTPKGEHVAAEIAERIGEVLQQAGNGLCETDRTVLYRSLELIASNLHEICRQYLD